MDGFSTPHDQSSGMMAQLHINPRSALVDEAFHLQVTGLQPNQPITLAAMLQEGACFLSHAQYTANGKGEIDLNTCSSRGGSYIGVEPMGLIWSMSPACGERPGTRLVKKDVTTPIEVEFSVLPNTVTVETPDAIKQAAPLAQSRVERWYIAPGVQRVVLREGRLRGTLFLPPGEGPFPGVIDMFGSAGGLYEYRASLLASRGIAALALAFFGYEDLPSHVDLELEYFDEAINWLCQHPKILTTGIGVVAVSMGAELALHMAACNSQIRATVAINSAYVYTYGNYTYKGKQSPTFFPSWSAIEHTDEGMIFKKTLSIWDLELPDLDPDTIIPVEKIESPVLLIHGEDDQACDPEHGEIIARRMKEHGRSNCRLIVYPGAGHLIEPPHAPTCRVTYHKLADHTIVYGGDPKLHARAQEASWQEIITFFRSNLVRPDNKTSSKL